MSRPHTRHLGGPTSNCLFTDVSVALNTYRHYVKRGDLAFLAIPKPPLCLMYLKISGKPAKLGENLKVILD